MSGEHLVSSPPPPVRPSVCLSVRLSVCLSVRPSLRPSPLVRVLVPVTEDQKHRVRPGFADVAASRSVRPSIINELFRKHLTAAILQKVQRDLFTDSF